MKLILNALMWIAAGLALGLVISLIFLQPAPQPSGTIAPPGQEPPAQNLTQPGLPLASEVNITVVLAPDCELCNSEGYMLMQAEMAVGQSDFLTVGESREINFTSVDGAAMVAKYGITELPAIVIEGPVLDDGAFVSAWEQQVGTLEDDGALVSRSPYPPYYDIAEGRAVGLVDAIGISPDGCLECSDVGLMMASLEEYPAGMTIAGAAFYEENDSEAQALISKYNITRLPVIFLGAQGAMDYPIYEQLALMGTVEDGWLIMRTMLPPYVDLAANRTVRGLVTAYLLEDPSCGDCLDVEGLSDYLEESSGIVVVNRTVYETNSTEGMALLSKYNITAVPTMVYSPELSDYPSFEDVWKRQNSTVEEDGWFVFRAHHLLGNATYVNVSG